MKYCITVILRSIESIVIAPARKSGRKYDHIISAFRYAENLLAIEFMIQDIDLLFRKPESHGLS